MADGHGGGHGGGHGEDCIDLSFDECDSTMHCQWNAETEACEFGMGGGMDFDYCPELLDVDTCDASENCLWNADSLVCEFNFGGGWGFDDCTDLTVDECDSTMHCQWNAETEACEFGMGGGMDFDYCPDLLDEDTCATSENCLWNADSLVCEFDFGGGWGFDDCADLTVDECDSTMHCQWNAETEACEFGMGGGMDFDYCPELLDEDTCDASDNCLWNADSLTCEFDFGGGWGGGGCHEQCAELTQEDCDLAEFCEWDADGSVCDSMFGWGDDGDSLGFHWGWGNWNWNESGYDQGDINVDYSIDVLDVVFDVGFIVQTSDPTDYQFWAGDFNSDLTLNVLDIVTLVNGILAERSSFEPASATMNGNQLVLDGAVGGIQFRGKLTSPVYGDDILVTGNGINLIYNLNGAISTQSLTFNQTPSDLIIASRDGQLVNVTVADEYRILEAYPNPFNPSTNIQYQVNLSGSVEITVYNLMGQGIVTLVDQNIEAGNYSVVWNGFDSNHIAVPSGAYLVRMTQSSGYSSQMITLLK